MARHPFANRSRPRPRPGGGQVGPKLTLALTGTLLPGSAFTLTAIVTGANPPVTALSSVSVTVGGVPAPLSGTGLIRTGTIPEDAEEGLAIVAAASIEADGQTISATRNGVVTGVPVAPPVNTLVPSISGALTVGSTLTIDPGVWEGADSYAFAIFRNSSVIILDSPFYVLTAADVGASFSPRVTGSNAGGDAVATGAAVGPVTEAASALVSLGGWTIETATPAAMVGSIIPVTRHGFNALGQPVTLVDDVLVKMRLREPYPNPTMLTADRVLSDFIYVGDSIPGMTNMSLRPAPLPFGQWLTMDRQICKSNTFTVKLAVAHAYARLGRPVAAVKFIATDGTTTREITVSTMTTATYAVSGVTAPHFEGTFDFTAFPNGAEITVDAIIYPWVGAAFQLSLHADPYPSPNLTTMRVLNDRLNTFGAAYAYVDAVNGTASGVASDNDVTAAASPFLTVAQAGAAIRAYNNTHYGRNYADGGIIRQKEGTTTLSAFKTLAPTLRWPLTIEAADPAKKDTTIFQDAGASLSNGLPLHLVLRKISVGKNITTTGTAHCWQNGGNYDALFAFDDVTVVGNGIMTTGYWSTLGRFQVFNSHVAATGGETFVAATHRIGLMGVGSYFEKTGSIGYGYAGCKSPNFAFDGAKYRDGNRPELSGAMIYYCDCGQTVNGTALIKLDMEINARGFALVGSVMEMSGGDGVASIWINADKALFGADNILIMQTTMAVPRTNFLYNENHFNRQFAYYRNNYSELRATKSDMFSSDGTCIGNWPVRYNVGSYYNATWEGGRNELGYSPSSWLGEIGGIGDRKSESRENRLHVAFTNPQSVGWGAGTGGGDYTPLPETELPRIPGALVPYPVDLRGRVIPTDGTAVTGALQMAA